MPIFKVKREENFTIVNNNILRNKDASLKAKGLLVWMLSCDKDWNFSLSGMVSCLKEKEDAISSAIKELESLGYLKREKLMPKTDSETGEVIRSRVEWVYYVYDTPQKSQDEILYTDFQSIEFQSTENPSIRNTNKKEILNKESTGAGASSKNSHLRSFRRERQSLEDKLSSAEIITAQKNEKKKSPKDKFRDECLDIIDKEYSDDTGELLKEYFDFVTAVPDNKDNLCKRVKTTKAWRHKLDRLDELVKDGYDCKKIIQQSLDKKQYVFYPLQSEKSSSTKIREGNQSKIVTCDPEKAKQIIEKAYESEVELF